MVTRTFPLTAIQTAIQTRLTGDSTLMALVHLIADTDSVPIGTALPYITYGSHTEAPWQTFGKRNCQGKFALDIWGKSREQAYAVMAEVSRLLDNWQFTLTDYVGFLIPDYTNIFSDEAQSSWHMPVSFVIYAIET